MLNRSKIFNYIEKKYSIKPDYPFEKYPLYAALRHLDNQKWFALIMNVSEEKLGLKSDEKIDILNIKCPSEKRDSLKKRKGIYPAYHMDKKSWITLALSQGDFLDEEIFDLLDESYSLTR